MDKARICIGGLTDDQAIGVLPAIKQAVRKLKAQVDIDHPDPPTILDKEYSKVEMAVQKLDDYLDDAGDWDYATKLSDAREDLKSMVAMGKKLDVLIRNIANAVSAFEFAMLGLENKAGDA